MALPPELQPFRNTVEAYVLVRLQRFAYVFAQRINPNLTPEQVEYATADALNLLSTLGDPAGMLPPQALRLVLRHDCLSSGCGDAGCTLCQYNPSRICRRNLKAKYLIDDHLRAKCGAGLRVEIVDESGQCVTQPLHELQLEVHVLNGEKYKEVCPDNTLLSSSQLRGCIIVPQPKRPLLKRESALGVMSEDVRTFLPIEAGQAPLSDLQCTTSSEALLAGKAPTFRLLVWAIDANGVPLPNVTYVVSESFVVATKRVKHAIKSDIPSIGDHVSKLVHIGKATVDKLLDLRQAAAEEGVSIDLLPAQLNRVDKVGTFRQLVELTEANADLKHKVRHLLKLSPEKWEEVTHHALSAVVPDFRPRVWWAPGGVGALVFACKNGAVLPEQPLAYVTRDPSNGAEVIVPIQQAEPALFAALPKLKQQAMQDWFAPGHSGWAAYWQDPTDPLAQQMQPGSSGPSLLQAVPLGMAAAAMSGSSGSAIAAAAAAAAADQQQQQQAPNNDGTAQYSPLPPEVQQLHEQKHPVQQQQQQQHPSASGGSFVAQQQQQQQHPSASGGSFVAQQQQQQHPAASGGSFVAQQQQQQHPAASGGSASAGGGYPGAGMPPVAVPMPGQQRHSMPGFSTARSPFATQGLQQTLSAAFPAWSGGGGSTPAASGGGTAPPSGGGVARQSAPGTNAAAPSAADAAGAQAAAVHTQARPPLPHPSQQQQQQHHAPGSMRPPAVPHSNELPKLPGAMPSLEMLNTEDLPSIDRNASLWHFDSFQQQVQMLPELPSEGIASLLAEVTRGRAAAPGNVAAGSAAAGVGTAPPAGGLADGQPDLSLKFSMSLDLSEGPEDLRSASGSAGSGGQAAAGGMRP